MIGGMDEMWILNTRYELFGGNPHPPPPKNVDDIQKKLEPLNLPELELTRIMKTCRYDIEQSVSLALTYKLFWEGWPGYSVTHGAPPTTIDNLITVRQLIGRIGDEIAMKIPQLIEITNVDIENAEILLSQTGGDIERALELYLEQKPGLDMLRKSQGTSSTTTQEINPEEITQGIDPMGPLQLVQIPGWSRDETPPASALVGVDTKLTPPLCMGDQCMGNQSRKYPQ